MKGYELRTVRKVSFSNQLPNDKYSIFFFISVRFVFVKSDIENYFKNDI